MSTVTTPEVDTIDHLDFDTVIPCETGLCERTPSGPNLADRFIAYRHRCWYVWYPTSWAMCRQCWDTAERMASGICPCGVWVTRETLFRVVRVIS